MRKAQGRGKKEDASKAEREGWAQVLRMEGEVGSRSLGWLAEPDMNTGGMWFVCVV